jgi:hypothetical protein
VQLQGCSLHRNRFGGLWLGGTATGLTAAVCNFVANGSDNHDAGKDVAIYSDGPAANASDCFFGVAAGPTFDGAGLGNGVIGAGVTTTPVAPAPHDAAATSFAAVASRELPAGDRSVALLAADLTADGWNEVVTVGDRAGTVEVHVNSATGFVAHEVAVIAGSQPGALAAAAFDADAHRDVAVLDALGMQVVVLFGDGTGRLAGPRTVAVPRRPIAIAAADLDAQAGADLVVASQGDAFGPGGVSVLRNDGTGQFTSVMLAGAVQPCALALLDLDGDSDLDLVAFDLDPAGPGLRRWLNDGNAGFGASLAIPVDAHPVTGASLVMLDQDGGAPDLAVASFQLLPLPGVCRVRLFRGDGAGSFAAPVLLRTRQGPVALHRAAIGGGDRPSLLALDRSARTVLVLGPLAADAAASFPYAETTADTPLAIAVAPITNRSTDDVVVAEAVLGRLVTERGRRPAVVERYGAGCRGATVVPNMLWASLPQVGSATFAIGFDAADGNAPAVLALGVQPVDFTLPGGCRVLVDVLLTLGAVADGSGAGSVPFAVPDSPALLGASLYGQWYIVAAGGQLNGVLSNTAGLRVTIGG